MCMLEFAVSLCQKQRLLQPVTGMLECACPWDAVNKVCMVVMTGVISSTSGNVYTVCYEVLIWMHDGTCCFLRCVSV